MLRGRFKDVLLLSLDWCRPKDPPISLGTASILAHLREGGVTSTALSYNVNASQFDTAEVVEHIFAQNPNKRTLLGIGAFVWNEAHVQTILLQLRKYRFPGCVLLGGPQISYTTSHPEVYYPRAEIFCRGYAEQAIYTLVSKATTENPCPSIGGIVYKGLPDMRLQATCQLEALPSPYLSGLVLPQRFLRWETQRGCPFRCSFCQHRESQLATSSGLQTRKPFDMGRLFQEAMWFSEKGVSDLAVLDPTFNSGPNYQRVLDALIDCSYQGKISLQCRFEMVKEGFLERIVKLNSLGANTVLEFGLQTVVKEEARAIYRPNRMEKVKEVIERLNHLGIHFEVSLIFGLPLQTLDSFKRSVNFCLDLRVPVVKAWPLMLLRGTPLDAEETRTKYQLRERSISASEEIDRVQVNIPHVVESSTFTEKDWLEMADVAAALARTECSHPSFL